MESSAKYRVLGSKDLEHIHEATLRLLGDKGVVFQSEDAIEILGRAGARIDGQIVFIPPSLVEKCMSMAPPVFRMRAIDDKKSVTVGEGLLIHPAGGEVFMRDHNGDRRQATLTDYENLQKLYQALENVDMAGYQPVTPCDISAKKRGLRCAVATMLYTDKPWLAPMEYEGAKKKEQLLDLYEIAFGSDFLKENYVTWNVVSPESPLVYGEVCCDGILSFARRNQPVCIVSAPMSGITAPIHMFGTILLQNAETVAGVCLAQLAAPGLPVLPSASLTYGNLKLATWECACPDSALMTAAAVQMYSEYYHLPTRAQTGVTSAKHADFQAGMETMQSLLLNAMAGVNVTSQSVGTLENLMTASLEKTVADDELVSRVRKLLSGVNTDAESLSLDIIMETKHGGDFLIHDSTLEYCRDGWQPSISDWDLFDKWKDRPDREIMDRAHIRVLEILENAKEPILDASTAKKLKEYVEKV